MRRLHSFTVEKLIQSDLLFLLVHSSMIGSRRIAGVFSIFLQFFYRLRKRLCLAENVINKNIKKFISIIALLYASQPPTAQNSALTFSCMPLKSEASTLALLCTQ